MRPGLSIQTYGTPCGFVCNTAMHEVGGESERRVNPDGFTFQQKRLKHTVHRSIAAASCASYLLRQRHLGRRSSALASSKRRQKLQRRKLSPRDHPGPKSKPFRKDIYFVLTFACKGHGTLRRPYALYRRYCIIPPHCAYEERGVQLIKRATYDIALTRNEASS